LSKVAYDIVIVGAGIVGAACAEQLARRGTQRLVQDRARAEQLDPTGAGRRGTETVEAAEHALLHSIGLGRHRPVGPV